MSATLLDAWPGYEKASRRLVLAGLAAAVRTRAVNGVLQACLPGAG